MNTLNIKPIQTQHTKRKIVDFSIKSNQFWGRVIHISIVWQLDVTLKQLGFTVTKLLIDVKTDKHWQETFLIAENSQHCYKKIKFCFVHGFD